MIYSTADLGTFRRVRDAIIALSKAIDTLYSKLKYILIYKFGDVLAGNYSSFESDGTLVYNGDATVWEDANVGTVNLGTAASAPDLITLGGGLNTIMVRAFDGNATTEQLFGEIEIPHSAKNSANITFHIHWCPTTADAGNVKWQLTYVLYHAGALPVEQTISVVSAASGTAWAMQRSDFPVIVASIEQQLSFRLFRNPGDVSDTYSHDAAVFTVGFHYEKDTNGSRTITSK